MLTQSRRLLLLAVALFLFLPIVLLQSRIDPLYQKNYAPQGKGLNQATRNLPVEFALGASTGFREAVAGLAVGANR